MNTDDRLVWQIDVNDVNSFKIGYAIAIYYGSN